MLEAQCRRASLSTNEGFAVGVDFNRGPCGGHQFGDSCPPTTREVAPY